MASIYFSRNSWGLPFGDQGEVLTSMPVHPAYPAVESIQQSRKFLDMIWDPSRPTRIGDVHKAVERIYEASVLEHLPMRLFLGEDCVRRIKEKLQRVTMDLDEFEKWSEGLLEDELVEPLGLPVGPVLVRNIAPVCIIFQYTLRYLPPRVI